jgi:hypothetical protein
MGERVARFLVFITHVLADRAMCGVGCHHLTYNSAWAPAVEVSAKGRIWSIVREVDSHVGNMLDGLSRVETRIMGCSGALSIGERRGVIAGRTQQWDAAGEARWCLPDREAEWAFWV